MAMLKAIVPTEDDYKTFLRPAVFDSLIAVLKFYGLEGSAEIIYNGENEISKLVGSNANDNQRTNTYTEGSLHNRLYIVPEFTPSEFDNENNLRREQTERPVWSTTRDVGGVDLALYPEYTGTRIDVSIIGIFNSSKTAEHFVRRMKRMQANQVTDMSFNPNVNMIVNPGILELFKDIYDLLKKNESDTPEFWDWFSLYRNAPFTKITNVAGNHARLTVPRRFNNVGIQFQSPLLSRARKNQTVGRYEVELRYFFYLSEFPNWALEYPLNIYQDQIPDRWISPVQEQHSDPYPVVINYETALSSQITGALERNAPYALRLPAHDPWAKPKQAWVQSVIQVRLGLLKLPEQRLGNIFDIPNYDWNERAKNYILRRGNYCLNHHSSPFLIQVYSGNIPVLPSQLSLTDGVLHILREPYLRNTYRITISVDFAIRDYSDEFWDDLDKHPEDWNLLPDIFNWYDWTKIPQPWGEHLDDIRKDIDKGTGLPTANFNIYQCELGLIAYNARSINR